MIVQCQYLINMIKLIDYIYQLYIYMEEEYTTLFDKNSG